VAVASDPRLLDLLPVAALRLKHRTALRDQERVANSEVDIADFAESEFYIPEVQGRTSEGPIRLILAQKAILRYSLSGSFSTVIKSTIKKSGKSTLAAIVARYIAEKRSRYGEVYCIGNDERQARGRSFKFISDSIKLTPGYQYKGGGDGLLPGRWRVQATRLECLSSGTKIEAIPVDARGEAGGNPDLSIWTELWGFEYEEALRFWEEMTPVPTKPNSMRLVETYAGYDGESLLLKSLYDLGLQGRQLTNHELATSVARDMEGERYDDFLMAFAETKGDPEALVPVWVNEAAGLFMYWDSGLDARRLPWQLGEAGDAYYAQQEEQLPPKAFRRLHHNEWVGAESQFVPLTAWDACREDLPPFLPGTKEPVVLAADAATTSDCFGIVAVTRHPHRHDDVAVRAVRRWDPKETGRVDYDEAEAFLREVCKGYNVVQIAYDPYQLESMMQKLRKEAVAWCEEFPQGYLRLKADRQLYDLIVQKRLAHDGNEYLREHVANAHAKLQKDQDSTLRIVKKAPGRKIDLVVATSMASYRCLYLLL